jgi:hypothetical protein
MRNQEIETVDFSPYPRNGLYTRRELSSFYQKTYRQWNILESVLYRDHPVLFERNFLCRGPYCDEQVIELKEAGFTMWSKNQLNTVKIKFPDQDLSDLDKLIGHLEEAVRQLGLKCQHERPREMSDKEVRDHGHVNRMFDNWYICDNCGEIWCHDSSG